MDFKDRLKQLRNWRGLTQDQLGDKAGVGQSTIGNYEAGTRVPKLDVELPALAAALRVPVADLFTDSPPEQVGISPTSHSMRMDPGMLLAATRETRVLLDIELHGKPLTEASEKRWAELVATVYPLVVRGGGDLTREDASALTQASIKRAKTGGQHGGRSRRKRGGDERGNFQVGPPRGD